MVGWNRSREVGVEGWRVGREVPTCRVMGCGVVRMEWWWGEMDGWDVPTYFMARLNKNKC